jgi:zinc/manganese transport system substrate-binding protein
MTLRSSLVKITATLTLLTALLPLSLKAEDKLPVVATFSILGDMVQRIGGSAIEVTTLVGRNGDTHVYQPTPADAKAVKQAAILFTNGLEFEGWLDRLAEAAEFNGQLIVTTDGIDTIAFDEHGDDEHHDDKHGDKHHEDKHDDEHHGDEHHDEDKHDDENHGDEHHDEDKHDDEHHDHHHGEFDPHAWQSLNNAIVYADNIAAALAKAAPENAATFYENRAAYVTELKSLDSEIETMIATLPETKRTVVTSHDAFQYFGRDYGLTFLAPQGLSTESEASARDVAKLIEQIRAESISAVFVENVADPRLIQQIANETGSVVGGKLYPGALSEEGGPAATYLDLMRHNATTIANAVSAAKKM